MFNPLWHVRSGKNIIKEQIDWVIEHINVDANKHVQKPWWTSEYVDEESMSSLKFLIYFLMEKDRH